MCKPVTRALGCVLDVALAHRPYKVLRHSIGQQGDDEVVYEEKDEVSHTNNVITHFNYMLDILLPHL